MIAHRRRGVKEIRVLTRLRGHAGALPRHREYTVERRRARERRGEKLCLSLSPSSLSPSLVSLSLSLVGQASFDRSIFNPLPRRTGVSARAAAPSQWHESPRPFLPLRPRPRSYSIATNVIRRRREVTAALQSNQARGWQRTSFNTFCLSLENFRCILALHFRLLSPFEIVERNGGQESRTVLHPAAEAWEMGGLSSLPLELRDRTIFRAYRRQLG